MYYGDSITLYREMEESGLDTSNPYGKPKKEVEDNTYICNVRVVNDYENKLPTGLKTGKTIKVHLRSDVEEFDYAIFKGKKFKQVGKSYGFGRDITITMERVGGVADEN